ncbi:MAG: pirin family protein [Armatimonadota bacterium]
MAVRQVGIVMTPVEAHEAKGVIINRTIGSEKLVLLDPFLLCDHLTVADDGTDVNEVGFPRHPHRGIETLTYVFAGRMKHKDSMGNEEVVNAGETQFMTAGAGLFHEEMVFVDDNGHESLQLWFNLPASQKKIMPAYRAAHNDEVPVVTTAEGAVVRIVAGAFSGSQGPLTGIAADPTYLQVTLPQGASITLPVRDGDTAFAYVYRGEGTFGANEKAVSAPKLAIFAEEGDTVTASAGPEDMQFIFASARPWKEPVLQYRSLVLSSVTEMQEALEDLENGTFAKY